MQYLRTIGVLIGLTVLLSGCQLALLHPDGKIAAAETRILIEASLIMLIVVVPALLLTLVIAWRYSVKRESAKYSPEFSHSLLLESIWWGIPCIIIIILGVITWVSTHNLDPYRPMQDKVKPMEIDAIALNWKWLFIYPKENIATVNYINFPVNTPVEFMITSDAPMNSFQIDQLAGQIYAMAGMRTRIHMMASKPGKYRGLSTNYSGAGFADMTFTADVGSKEDFEKWVEQVKESRQHLSLEEYGKLEKDSINDPVMYFSTAARHIFDFAIEKYTKPNVTIENFGKQNATLPVTKMDKKDA